MRFRLLLAVLCACSLAVVAAPQPANAQPCNRGPGGIPCGPSSDTSSLVASSGGCLPPSAAVDLYLEASRGFAINGGSHDEASCEKICDKFVDTCDEIAKVSKACQNRGGGEYAELMRAICTTFANREERNLCKREVNAFRGFVRDCTNADRVRAAGCCENHAALCLKECLHEWIGPSDFQACFTGPGGYAGGTCYFTLLNEGS